MFCKPHKSNGLKGSLDSQTIQERVAREYETDQINHYYKDYYPSGPYEPYDDSAGVIYWDWDDNWEEWQHTWSPSKK